MVLAAATFGRANAQSLLDLLNGKSVQSSEKKSESVAEKINKDALTGVWKYSAAAVEFTGTDLVAVLGSSMAAPTIKQSLETYYTRAGVTSGSCTIEFKDNDKYIACTAKDRLEGPYSFDHPGQKIELTYDHKEIGGKDSLDARLKFADGKLSVMFEADKIVAIIKEMTKNMELEQNVRELIDMISEYKGLYLGFQLEK